MIVLHLDMLGWASRVRVRGAFGNKPVGDCLQFIASLKLDARDLMMIVCVEHSIGLHENWLEKNQPTL